MIFTTLTIEIKIPGIPGIYKNEVNRAANRSKKCAGILRSRDHEEGSNKFGSCVFTFWVKWNERNYVSNKVSLIKTYCGYCYKAMMALSADHNEQRRWRLIKEFDIYSRPLNHCIFNTIEKLDMDSPRNTSNGLSCSLSFVWFVTVSLSDGGGAQDCLGRLSEVQVPVHEWSCTWLYLEFRENVVLVTLLGVLGGHNDVENAGRRGELLPIAEFTLSWPDFDSLSSFLGTFAFFTRFDLT